MFGDPAANPKTWPRRALGALGSVITGNTPSRADSRNFGTGVEWIKSDNINGASYYVTPAAERLSETGARVGRLAPAGAILVTCIAGSPTCIGNAAMTDREVAFNQQINALVPRLGNAHFLFSQFRLGKPLIQMAASSGMKGMVSKSRFEQIEFVFPPLRLQDAFAERTASIASLKTSQAISLRSLDALFASLQHRAFRGEL